MPERIDPQMASNELVTLTEFLDWYRETLFIKIAGLTDEQARTPTAPPSGLNLMGLVRHMAEVERNWFQRVYLAADVQPIFYTDANPDGDLLPSADDTVQEATDAFGAEIAAAQQAVAGASLDSIAVALRHGETVNLRWILVHMIEEYARHCGHADLLREATDGEVGD